MNQQEHAAKLAEQILDEFHKTRLPHDVHFTLKADAVRVLIAALEAAGTSLAIPEDVREGVARSLARLQCLRNAVRERKPIDDGQIERGVEHGWQHWAEDAFAVLFYLTSIGWGPKDMNRSPRDTEREAVVSGVLDAAENMLIAYGMGWDMDGVAEVLKSKFDSFKHAGFEWVAPNGKI